MVNLFENWTPEMLEALRYSGKGSRNYDPKVKYKISRAVKISAQREGASQRRAEASRRNWIGLSKEEKRKRLEPLSNSKGFLGKTHSEFARERISEGLRKNKDRKKELSKAQTLRYLDPRERLKTSRAMKAYWGSLSPGEQAEKMENSWHSEESRVNRSRTLKEKWSNDPEFVGMMMRAWKATPNLEELVLRDILDKLFPGEWKFVGDGSDGTSIGGRVPDFININGEKEVLELFGPYWHPESDVEERVSHYARYGFGCTIIWTDENNELGVTSKLAKRYLRDKLAKKKKDLGILYKNVRSKEGVG